jgi:hypothetical protein
MVPVNETTGALTFGLYIIKGLLEKHHFLERFSASGEKSKSQ